MFRKPRRETGWIGPSEIETDEQIIANMERLQAMQEKSFRSSVAWAIDSMAKRLERRNGFRE